MGRTIRQYGREPLAASGEEQRTRRRHHAFHLALAERVADGWSGPGQPESLARMRAEHADLRVAPDHGGDPQATLALAAAPEPDPARAGASWVADCVAALRHDRAAAYPVAGRSHRAG
ncbi:hypothetical protein [Streptomyces brasiliscabiei]|uniref:hypothetical protein n=1 Tax=Streptomyces brasiliscabiei TaxID=2736302 RepID=UPI001C111D89|nr:hypothetical protein [Streptomyces brasiliscabiei]